MLSGIQQCLATLGTSGQPSREDQCGLDVEKKEYHQQLTSPLQQPAALPLAVIGRFPFGRIFGNSGQKSKGTGHFPEKIDRKFRTTFRACPKSGNSGNFENVLYHLVIFRPSPPQAKIPATFGSRTRWWELRVQGTDPFSVANVVFYRIVSTNF